MRKTLYSHALLRAFELIGDVAVAKRLGISRTMAGLYLEGLTTIPDLIFSRIADLLTDDVWYRSLLPRKIIEQHDFEEAIDRIQLGLKKSGRAMTDEEKRRVSFHESGHALVAISVDHAHPVHRVTIIPRSIGALALPHGQAAPEPSPNQKPLAVRV